MKRRRRGGRRSGQGQTGKGAGESPMIRGLQKIPPPPPKGSPGGRTLGGISEREFRKKYAPELAKPGPLAKRILKNHRAALEEKEVEFLESLCDYERACKEVGRPFWGSAKQNAWLLGIHGRLEGVCPTCGRRVE